jgi:hypothetical protein
VFVSENLVGHDVAVRRSKAGRMAVRFYDVDLGLFDLAAAPTHRPRPETRRNHKGTLKVSPMSCPLVVISLLSPTPSSLSLPLQLAPVLRYLC